jgi:hypothetical protein
MAAATIPDDILIDEILLKYLHDIDEFALCASIDNYRFLVSHCIFKDASLTRLHLIYSLLLTCKAKYTGSWPGKRQLTLGELKTYLPAEENSKLKIINKLFHLEDLRISEPFLTNQIEILKTVSALSHLKSLYLSFDARNFDGKIDSSLILNFPSLQSLGVQLELPHRYLNQFLGNLIDSHRHQLTKLSLSMNFFTWWSSPSSGNTRTGRLPQLGELEITSVHSSFFYGTKYAIRDTISETCLLSIFYQPSEATKNDRLLVSLQDPDGWCIGTFFRRMKYIRIDGIALATFLIQTWPRRTFSRRPPSKKDSDLILHLYEVSKANDPELAIPIYLIVSNFLDRCHNPLLLADVELRETQHFLEDYLRYDPSYSQIIQLSSRICKRIPVRPKLLDVFLALMRPQLITLEYLVINLLREYPSPFSSAAPTAFTHAEAAPIFRDAIRKTAAQHLEKLSDACFLSMISSNILDGSDLDHLLNQGTSFWISSASNLRDLFTFSSNLRRQRKLLAQPHVDSGGRFAVEDAFVTLILDFCSAIRI